MNSRARVDEPGRAEPSLQRDETAGAVVMSAACDGRLFLIQRNVACGGRPVGLVDADRRRGARIHCRGRGRTARRCRRTRPSRSGLAVSILSMMTTCAIGQVHAAGESRSARARARCGSTTVMMHVGLSRRRSRCFPRPRGSREPSVSFSACSRMACVVHAGVDDVALVDVRLGSSISSIVHLCLLEVGDF